MLSTTHEPIGKKKASLKTNKGHASRGSCREGYSLRQLLANAAIAASRVGS
jgi:hypothetical protein